MSVKELLPVGTRIKHNGHGNGTVVGYNLKSVSKYLEENLNEAIDIANKAGMLNSVVNSFYDGDRYPYKVHFEPTVEYPNGYKDVYSRECLDVVIS